MSGQPAILAEGLSRDFGDVKAVDRLGLRVEKGELFGLVGPDGAGKTTVMRLLASILDPTGGEAWISGLSVITESEPVKEKIGYMSQRFGLYEDLTVIENINFYADIYEVPESVRPSRTERLLGFSNLTPFKDRLAGRLSGGMKQKLGLACALIHTPEVLLLDEPTNGVDPVSRRDFWKILYELVAEGITVFVSTAYLDEAERCARIALIHRGRIIETATPDSIRRSMEGDMIEIWCEGARTAASAIQGVRNVLSVSSYGDRLHVLLSEGSGGDEVKAALINAGHEVKGLRKILPSLEDVFIKRVASG